VDGGGQAEQQEREQRGGSDQIRDRAEHQYARDRRDRHAPARVEAQAHRAAGQQRVPDGIADRKRQQRHQRDPAIRQALPRILEAQPVVAGQQ
jgi:hypothetical protein